MRGPLHLTLEVGQVGVARLGPDEAVPAWSAAPAVLRSVTRTPDETSVIGAWEAIPDDVTREGPFALLTVTGPLDFSLIGVMAAISTVLAAADVSIFVISTYDTDYVMVAADRADAAVSALTAAGHLVTRKRPG